MYSYYFFFQVLPPWHSVEWKIYDRVVLFQFLFINLNRPSDMSILSILLCSSKWQVKTSVGNPQFGQVLNELKHKYFMKWYSFVSRTAHLIRTIFIPRICNEAEGYSTPLNLVVFWHRNFLFLAEVKYAPDIPNNKTKTYSYDDSCGYLFLPRS